MPREVPPMIGRPTTTPCTCGGVFTEYRDGVTDPGCEGNSTCEVVTLCQGCGRTIEEVAAEAEHKAPIAAMMVALKATGTDKH